GRRFTVKLFFVGLKSIDSDHLPLILNLNEKDKAKAGAKRQGSESDHIAQEEGTIKIEEDILGWKKDKIAEYQEVIWEKWNEKITERETELEWNDMKEIIYNGAKETGMSKKRKECDKADKTKKEWFNNECKLKREEVWKALEKLSNEKDSNNKSCKIDFIEAKRIYNETVRIAKEEWWENKKKEINNAKDMSKWWELINKYRKKRRNKKLGGKISGKTWVKHFAELLNKKEVNEKTVKETEKERIDENTNSVNREDERNEWDENICRLEFRKAIERLGNNKAPGEDGIKAEFIKNLPREIKEELRGIINNIWSEGKMPNGWKKARIVPILKGGHEEKTENYRGISLLNIGYKLLTTIMANRIMEWADREGKIKESQAGFRRGRGTRDHIFMLNALINNKLKRKEKLFVGFIDLKAAFDTVNRKILIKKVRGRDKWKDAKNDRGNI
ncbi:GSCOCG00013007001-RA-CDS, partial [Cotesia congregata]